MAFFNLRSNARVLVTALLFTALFGSAPSLRAAGDSAESAATRTQDIHFGTLPDHAVDGSLIPLLATATSGLKVRFTVVSGPAQVVGSQLMLTGPGTVVIRASQPGDATHSAASPVEHSFQALAPAAATADATTAAPTTPQAPAPTTVPGVAETPTMPAAPTQPETPASEAAPAVASTPATTPSAPSASSDLIPQALVNAATGHVGPAAANQLPAKLTLTLPGNVEMIFVRVPAGHVTLGSTPGETGHQADENFHNYSEPQGFLMSATEVTQAQYEALTGQRPSYFRSDWQSRPVEQIRWSDVARDASGFFARLNDVLQSSGHANFSAALPSDDQWEYACRAGTQTSYNNRTDLNFPINESAIREIATYGETETSAVATHSPNAWGLYDMHGNVAEWTREGSLRGGSFRDSPAFIRSASKQVGKAGSSDLNREAGFRIVLLPAAAGLDAQ